MLESLVLLVAVLALVVYGVVRLDDIATPSPGKGCDDMAGTEAAATSLGYGEIAPAKTAGSAYIGCYTVYCLH